MKASLHRHTTGHIYLGIKNRLALLRLALAVASVATITTNYVETVEFRSVPDSAPEVGAEETDDALCKPMSFVFGLYEGFVFMLRLACWACLTIEVLALNGTGVVVALAALWAVHVLWGREVRVEFGKIENHEQLDKQ